jgi:hypothetical protein
MGLAVFMAISMMVFPCNAAVMPDERIEGLDEFIVEMNNNGIQRPELIDPLIKDMKKNGIKKVLVPTDEPTVNAMKQSYNVEIQKVGDEIKDRIKKEKPSDWKLDTIAGLSIGVGLGGLITSSVLTGTWGGTVLGISTPFAALSAAIGTELAFSSAVLPVIGLLVCVALIICGVAYLVYAHW